MTEPNLVWMAFGGGALLAAMTIDLVAPVLLLGHYGALSTGFISRPSTTTSGVQPSPFCYRPPDATN